MIIDNIRSTEISPASSSSNGKVIPNYLRASSGSCHDLCKHGTREEHTKEVKESRPWRKSVKGNGPDVRHTKECKANTVKPKPSADPIIQIPSGETAVQEILAAPSEHFDVHNEQALSHTWTVLSVESFASDGNETTSSTADNKKQEISVPSDSVTVTVTEKEISSNAKDLNFSKKLSSTSKVNPSSRSPSPISKGCFENIKTDAEPELSSKKHIAAPKPKIVKMKPLPSSLKPPSPTHPLSSMCSNRRGVNNQLSEKINTSRVDAKKFPSSRFSVNGAESTITKKVGFIRVVSSARKEKDTNELNTPEGSPGSIKILSEKDSLASTNSKSSITLLPPVLSVSKSTIRSKASYAPPQLKKPLVGYKSKKTEQEALGQRKGSNAVEAESENHGPSKHKVRKSLLSKETSHSNRPSLRTRDVTFHSRDLVKSSINSDRHLLKHPSFSRKKKSGQVLFNKVIEETAKRLVRTRKSNVLALVGAFETVISIQKKSSSAAATKPKARKIRSFKKSPR